MGAKLSKEALVNALDEAEFESGLTNPIKTWIAPLEIAGTTPVAVNVADTTRVNAKRLSSVDEAKTVCDKDFEIPFVDPKLDKGLTKAVKTWIAPRIILGKVADNPTVADADLVSAF